MSAFEELFINEITKATLVDMHDHSVLMLVLMCVVTDESNKKTTTHSLHI